MTTLNTIIEEEEKGFEEQYYVTFDKHGEQFEMYDPKSAIADLQVFLTTAMQRAYEAGKADNAQENTPDTEKCEHKVVKKYCFRCKRPDLAGNVKNTPDTEWEKEFEKLMPEVSYEFCQGHLNDGIAFISNLLTSRDTYWKERVEEIVKNTNPVISGNFAEEGRYWTENFRKILLQALDNLK